MDIPEIFMSIANLIVAQVDWNVRVDLETWGIFLLLHGMPLEIAWRGKIYWLMADFRRPQSYALKHWYWFTFIVETDQGMDTSGGSNALQWCLGLIKWLWCCEALISIKLGWCLVRTNEGSLIIFKWIAALVTLFPGLAWLLDAQFPWRYANTIVEAPLIVAGFHS
jgi:hypothetical protein